MASTEVEPSHEHCRNCIRLNCVDKSSCRLIYCQAACGARFHSCKEDDHKLICLKEVVPCINKINGCPFIMNRGKISKHLTVCPASVIICKYEWNRWPMHSHDQGWKAPMPFKNPHVKCGQFDVAFAFRDQKVLMDSFKLPRRTRRILRNPLTRHYPVVPIQSHSSMVDSTISDCSQLSDDDSGTPWDLNCSPPGLQRTISKQLASGNHRALSNQLSSDNHLLEATKQATESLTKALDYVTGKAGLKRLAELAKKQEVAFQNLSLAQEGGSTVQEVSRNNTNSELHEVKHDTQTTEVTDGDEEDEFDVYCNEKQLYQILGLDLTMHFMPSYLPKPAKMFTFMCGQEFRRDEYAWHKKNIHCDIQANLNNWFEHRCPLAYVGCTFSYQRFKPKIPSGAMVHSSVLQSFGLTFEDEFITDEDRSDGNLIEEEDLRTEFGRNRLREATPEIYTSYKCDSSVKVIPRYKSVSRETSPIKYLPIEVEPYYSLTDLPFEVLRNIVRQLDSFSIQHLSMTCKLLQSVCCSLLEECGLVSIVWQKKNPEKDGNTKPLWDVAYKRWFFSTGFTPIRQWELDDKSLHIMAKHLAQCEFNTDINDPTEPIELVFNVEECEGVTRKELMKRKRNSRKKFPIL